MIKEYKNYIEKLHTETLINTSKISAQLSKVRSIFNTFQNICRKINVQFCIQFKI